MTDGRIAIFDEPTEGLDAEGCVLVSAVLKDLARRRCTIIVISHDPAMVKGANAVLDLNVKPVPQLRAGGPTPAPEPVDEEVAS